MAASDIKNVEAEAGVIASVVLEPELIFFSEQLRPNHFTNPQNAYVYFAVQELAKKGVDKVDAYNIMNILNMYKGTEHVGNDATRIISIPSLQDLLNNARFIARTNREDYMVVVGAVLDSAFRRHTYEKLEACKRICETGGSSDIEHQIYSTLDNVMLEFSTATEIPQFKDVVDGYFESIERKHQPNAAGIIPFKFENLNRYVQIERGELIIFGAEQKMGKSMMLLNCAADLLKRGYRVFYIDSELNSELFTCRMLSHLTGLSFRTIRFGLYNDEERALILQAKEWLKSCGFTHLYMPSFDEQSIYTSVKKVFHTQGIDVLIVDYFKGADEKDAFASYQSLGGLVDTVKNRICGEMNIAGIGAAQATSTGRLADSAKIARNASTILMLQSKTQEELDADGPSCGNKKLIVKFNRNGEQMADGEYIDMVFDGNVISYEEAQQHMPTTPY